MTLEEVGKLLNTLWKMSEAERLLLGNSNEVFQRITGEYIYSASSLETTSTFTITIHLPKTAYLYSNSAGLVSIYDTTFLTLAVKRAAEEQGICHEK